MTAAMGTWTLNMSKVIELGDRSVHMPLPGAYYDEVRSGESHYYYYYYYLPLPISPPDHALNPKRSSLALSYHKSLFFCLFLLTR